MNKSLKRLDHAYQLHRSESVTWIIMCSDIFEEDARLNLAKSIISNFQFITLDWEISSSFEPAVRRLQSVAGKSWLFTLVITEVIPSDQYKVFDRMFFQLKNLGFCRVVNLCSGNDLLYSLSSTYNVYFEDMSENTISILSS